MSYLKLFFVECFIISSIVFPLSASGCASKDNNEKEIPEQFPQWLETITYNNKIYEVSEVIVFMKCPQIYYDDERQKNQEKFGVELIHSSGNYDNETYGFDPDSVCNKIRTENAASSDFDDLIGNWIGEASTASHTYQAYALKEFCTNEAIAIQIFVLFNDSKDESSGQCCAECYLKYVTRLLQ